MTHAQKFLLGMLVLIASIQTADARRFRFFGIPSFGRGETIDLVHDLPDQEPFVVAGDFVDVGYLNGRSSTGYVLYHGSSYRKLDAEGISLLTGVLGFDPTAKHRAQYAADHAGEIADAKAEQANKDARIASGRLLERRPNESSADWDARRATFLAEHRSRSSSAISSGAASDAETQTASSGGLGFSGFAIIIVVILIVACRKSIAAMFASSKANADDDYAADGAGGDSDHMSFDERVAHRLRELNQGTPVHAQAEPQSANAPSWPQAAPARPAASGFGRKAV